MSLTKFIILVQKENESGKKVIVRLDTLDEVPRESIHMIKQPPTIFKFESNSQLPIYIQKKKGFKEKSNGLLAGDKIESIDYDYYSFSYCKF